jgi:type II secretory pathway component PulF
LLNFAYKAQTADARVVRGTLAAADAAAALEQVRRLRLRPIELRPWTPPPGHALLGRLRRGVPSGDKLLLLRQLHTMCAAGIPLVRALAALGQQVENERACQLLAAVRSDVEAGATLAGACARQPALFTPLEIQLVQAAEESGLLEQMLGRMADLHEKEMAVRRDVRSALFYPLLVIGELVIAIGVILKFVFPRFVEIFAGLSAELPAPTLLLIHLSNALNRWGWLLPLLLAGSYLGYRAARRRPGFALRADRAKLSAPIVGHILRKIQLSRFTHLLASLVDAGIPLVGALRLGADIMGNEFLRRDAVTVRVAVERGSSFAAALGEAEAFPPICREMVAVGEEAGRLVESLKRVSDYYEDQAQFAIKNLTVVIEPLLLLVLGAVVAFVALAVFLPMWNLMGAIRG